MSVKQMIVLSSLALVDCECVCISNIEIHICVMVHASSTKQHKSLLLSVKIDKNGKISKLGGISKRVYVIFLILYQFTA